MSQNSIGGPRPNSRGATATRQITIGEAAAIVRYMPEMIAQRGGSAVPLWAVLEYIDALQVCTTCGYPLGEHRLVGGGRSCKHFERHL